ncbi:unnamed protein product [Dovyalis caffra]|uniref:Uncharacterized protein n=1 Tax=Dovyalis caffra TaxID=77055 RepID=A0AAV1QP55_9ROSI|nr:unnamed protein product [Dovyalis caffra]
MDAPNLSANLSKEINTGTTSGRHQNNVSKPSLMERNATARTFEQEIHPNFQSDSERTIEWKRELEEDAGMSKNAQFRAIQPRSSILSSVEDNDRFCYLHIFTFTTYNTNAYGLRVKSKTVGSFGTEFDIILAVMQEVVKEYVSTRIAFLLTQNETKYQVIMTKTDLVFPIDVARHAMQIVESLKANESLVQHVMMVSSKYGAGKVRDGNGVLDIGGYGKWEILVEAIGLFFKT